MNTPTKPTLPFSTLLLLISFASVNAVMFTPALPIITQAFHLTADQAQQTMSYYLIGYTIGQLLYGPIANRYGRKNTLYSGITLQIISSLLCVLASYSGQFVILLICRFLMALGAGVGLKMTFTLVNETQAPKIASRTLSYLMLAFAITPALSVAIGGYLTSHVGWLSCFYAGAIYGVILLLFITQLPETLAVRNHNALSLKYLKNAYLNVIQDKSLVACGLLMGGSTSFVYVFAALCPFIVINLHGISSIHYGEMNLIPSLGLIFGSLVSAQLIKRASQKTMILTGISIASIAVFGMLLFTASHMPPLISIFLPMMLVYFGLSFVMSNAPTVALMNIQDKSNGSAVMSFINMGSATLAVSMLGSFSITEMLMPLAFMLICATMITLYFTVLTLKQREMTNEVNIS